MRFALLRASGEVVVQRLADETGDVDPGDFIFDRELRRADSDWQVVARDSAPLVK